MIDTHIHVTNTGLSGILEKPAPDGTPFGDPIDRVAAAIKAEMQAAGTTQALAMPKGIGHTGDPLGINQTLRLATLISGIHPVGLADPTQSEEPHLARVEEVLKTGKIKALKAYLGYVHYGPDAPGYLPYYKLAAKYKIPVIFHTGDTYSHRAKVKYAHPLLVDEIAVDHPDVNFVLAHFGNPWLVDAAEVVYKNNKRGIRENVWTDLSGLLVGDAAEFDKLRKNGMMKDVIATVRKAFDYTECPDRFLYGSDWPLAPMAPYRDFIRELIPAEFHGGVFEGNAKALFGL